MVVKLKKDFLKISNTKLKSRLIVGTGKYKNFKETAQAIKASGAEMVTVAVRRVNITDKKKALLIFITYFRVHPSVFVPFVGHQHPSFLFEILTL